MRPALLASILLGSAACGEPAIEVHLAPRGEPTPAFDYSCIGAVDVLPMSPSYDGDYDIGEVYSTPDEPIKPTCINLPRAPTSMADLATLLHDKLDIAIPSGGLQAMELRVRAGKCNEADWFEEANVYGGGVYTGDGKLTITLSHNLSCSNTTSYTFRPVDLLAMETSHACGPVTEGTVFVGNIRPTNFGIPSIEEDGANFGTLSGTVTSVKLQTYSGSFQGTCLAARYDDGVNDGAVCINPKAQQLCSATDFDVPIVSDSFLSNAETAVQPLVKGSYQPPVLVGVFQNESGQMMPVAGATVTVPGQMPAAGQQAAAQFVFGDPSDAASQTFVPDQTAQQTTASGMFMAYLNGVTELDVSAPGPGGTTLTGSTFVGPDEFDATSALIVVK